MLKCRYPIGQFEHSQLWFSTLQCHWSRQFHGDLAGFYDSIVISPTCSGVPPLNSINKAKTGTEVVSLVCISQLKQLSIAIRRQIALFPVMKLSFGNAGFASD